VAHLDEACGLLNLDFPYILQWRVSCAEIMPKLPSKVRLAVVVKKLTDYQLSVCLTAERE
jgi:hypothetical protein